MPLVPLRPLMEAAEQYGYAQGAFNVNAVAQAKAVIEMHETFRSPAILQGADLANAFMGGRVDLPTVPWRIKNGAPGTSPTRCANMGNIPPSRWCSTWITARISTAV